MIIIVAVTLLFYFLGHDRKFIRFSCNLLLDMIASGIVFMAALNAGFALWSAFTIACIAEFGVSIMFKAGRQHVRGCDAIGAGLVIGIWMEACFVMCGGWPTLIELLGLS